MVFGELVSPIHRVALRVGGEGETRGNSEVGTSGRDPASGYTVDKGWGFRDRHGLTRWTLCTSNFAYHPPDFGVPPHA